MKVQRTISLDERTAKIAGSMNNLSEWVRARLLAVEEGSLDEFSETLARMPTRRLIAIVLARIGEESRRGEDHTEAMKDAEAALLAVMLEGSA